MVLRYRTLPCEHCATETDHQANCIHHAAHIAFALLSLVWWIGYAVALARRSPPRWVCTQCGMEAAS
jgi:hypothetical protein